MHKYCKILKKKKNHSFIQDTVDFVYSAKELLDKKSEISTKLNESIPDLSIRH